MKEAYFDHNATTPIDPRVREAMLPWLGALHGNPSSVHSFGQRSREAVENARAEVAALLEVSESTQVVFTSSGTEANNTVVLGVARSAAPGGRLVISAIEHPSVEASAARLEEAGVEVVRVKPRRDGCVEPEAIESVLDEKTFLVCLMLANNELGTLQPVRQVAQSCRAREIPLLCDAVQAVGKIPVSVPDLGTDYLVLGGHKFNAPVGAAAVWVRPGVVFEGLHLGGGQERSRRAGTENVAALVGLGAAAALAASEVGERGRRMAGLRDRFERGLDELGDFVVHGARAERLPNTSHVAFPGVSAESLMIRLDLDGFAVSAGAACSSGKVEPSRVLLALGIGEAEALSSIRVSFGQGNDERQVDDLLEALKRHTGELRRLSAESTAGVEKRLSAAVAGGGSGQVAVAMSGGVDSSVAAWLLSRGERPVVGLSMLLWDRSKQERNGRCCGALDLGDARRVAQQCGIRHYTLHLEEDFRRQVVDPFVDDYLAGRTPVPCTRCNTFIKFELFLERARALGCDRIATGHYARIMRGPGGYELHRALEEDKDQSYYLFELTQDQLGASEFPLGDQNKSEVRDLARRAGLVVAEKGESMEVCFVDGGIRDFVEQQAAERGLALATEGTEGTVSTESTWSGASASRIVDREGDLVGRGEPYYRYTVGQRRALGGGAPEKLYVLGVRPSVNEVVVGPRRELASRGLIGERLHWIGDEPTSDVMATVKIRSRHPGVESRIRSLGKGRVEVDFTTPQEAVTPGQAAVFYQGSRVLGGCWIRGARE